MESDKVFASTIIRTQSKLQDSLYDLINIVPAVPLQDGLGINLEKDTNFVPRNDKYYVPKKKVGVKVKTVRNIRNDFESDIYTYLPADLETQKNLLLRKIRFGNAKEEKTRELAKNILKAKTPISKTAWQMIMNINPEDKKYPYQYILYNGKCIQINGSKGGKKKFIYKYDIGRVKDTSSNHSVPKIKIPTTKTKLLQHSLNVQFKPGPLSKKRSLDTSYQKYQFGDIKLVSLPKPGLDIQPSYGKPLTPFIHNAFLLNNNGIISEKWAEFSVSMLGTVRSGNLVQLAEGNITFDLDYRCHQDRILMRHDSDIIKNVHVCQNMDTTKKVEEESIIILEVNKVLNGILNCIEINLNQDDMYTGEDESRGDIIEKSFSTCNVNQLKDRGKRKFGELGRLDVTVITIAETPETLKNEICQNAHCRLGCVCDSLKCSYSLRRHCGQLECMFKCTCDFSKFKLTDSFDNDCSDIIPGLVNFDKKLGETLAKEEQKFHQTVIVTNEKSILLKPERRNWKASKKYADFYSNMQLKLENDKKLILSVACENLKIKNVEPWCMVHCLYKCFCKGKFIDTSYPKHHVMDESGAGTIINVIKDPENVNKVDKIDLINAVNTVYSSLRSRQDLRSLRNIKRKSVSDTNEPCVPKRTSDSDTNEPCVPKRTSDSDTNEPCVPKRTSDSDTNEPCVPKRTSDSDTNEPCVPKRTSNSDTNEPCVPKRTSDSDSNEACLLDTYLEYTHICARILPYSGRKYSDGYYHRMNQKIYNMERDDKMLRKRMTFLLSKDSSSDSESLQTETPTLEIIQPPSSLSELLSNVILHNSQVSNQVFDGETMSIDNLTHQNSKHSPNKATLVSWLEASYKQYKERSERGLTKTSLDPPKLGRVALYPWEFILGRYKERKNFFLISKQKPFRIFMAVNIKHQFFDNCINISDIVLSDLEKYPVTIKNLLTNATDFKDNFCILCGLSFCWELIGSVAKVSDSVKTVNNVVPLEGEFQSESISDIDNISISSENARDEINSPLINHQVSDQFQINCDQSKWFIMTIENDFKEIQFYKKGFFVKYESVIKAASVAKALGKTVRLSSQKCCSKKSGPQFGIYAIPSNKDNCVIIGPYEKCEPLGIETVKILPDHTKTERSRGIWITTNKVDDLKVIDNPLLFMPSANIDEANMVTLENYTTSSGETSKNNSENLFGDNLNKNNPEQIKTNENKVNAVKVVKPITIRKSNGFYELAPNGLLKQKPMLNKSLLINSSLSKDRVLNVSVNPNHNEDQKETVQSVEVRHRPIAEIAPQIKECSSSTAKSLDRKREGGMFILKPEEINRSYENKISCNASSSATNHSNDEINMDIENFLKMSMVYAPSRHNDVYIISDDEDDPGNNTLRDVYIVPQNIKGLGWIPGRQNSDYHLSFAFPGFNYSNFYTEKNAFRKINQVFAKKVYLPSQKSIKWEVVDSLTDVNLNKLTLDCLSEENILTKDGLWHKLQVSSTAKVKDDDVYSIDDSTDIEECTLDVNSESKESVSTAFEEASKTLDEESSYLWNVTVSKKRDLFKSFSETSEELRKELANKLIFIESDAQDMLQD